MPEDLPEGSSAVAKRRRKSAIKLRQLSVPSAATKESEAQLIIAVEESISAGLKCAFVTIFVAVVLDLVPFIKNHNIWLKLFDPNEPNLGWIDYVELFDSTTLLVSGLGILYGATIHEANKTGDDATKMNNTAHVFSFTFWIYLIIAADMSFVSLSIAITLPTISVNGPFHSILTGTESKLFMLVATIIVLGISIIISYCNTAAMTEDERDNKRISQEQIDSKNMPHFQRIRDVGKWAYLGMALAAGSYLIYACMDFAKWLVADKGTIARGLSLFDAVEPFAMTILLIKKSRSFLRLVFIHRDWTTSTIAKDAQVCIDHFHAEKSFYDKNTDVLVGLIITRVCEFAWPYVVPHASLALRTTAPTLYEKFFGGEL